MTELIVTHTSTVTEDQIDHLGHMNVRHYATNARRGTRAMLAELGWSPPRRTDDTAGMDVFDSYTRHHHEQLLGADLQVRSGVLGADADSVRLYHELSNVADGDLAATFVHRVRTNGAVPFDHLDTVTIPAHGATRSIDLDTDIIGSSPSLATVQDLRLPIRAPRNIDDVDTNGGRSMSSHMIPMLIWGGSTPDGTEFTLTHAGPNGEALGWATMETRLGINRLPELGTRIQAFGATTALADKTSQMTMWCFDLDRGDLLVTFDVVNLLFNIDARRAMSIPDDMRAEHESRLHPELAPR